jgi:hypothetical protein
MNFFVSRTLCFPALSLSLALSGCAGFLGVEIPVPAWEQDDDDAVADDDDDAGSLFVTLSGNVIATARMTGEPLSDWAYLNCAGKTVLYVFLDPNDLRSPAAKFTMDTPGQWDLTVDVNSGPYHVIGLTDNGNRILDCRFAEGIADAPALERELALLPGVVESGLFIDLAHTALIGADDGTVTQTHRRSPAS